MSLQVYADRMSQPSRAILIFCKVNGIDFEEIKVELFKRQHLNPEFKEINPMGQVPAIVHGRFKLFESHAILRYPSDLFKRATIESVLDWHHSNLRRGAVALIRNTVLGPVFGLKMNQEAAVEGEKILSASLEKIESFWLQGNGLFLLGSSEPSIADLSLVCELMQLELVDEKIRNRILGQHKKVQRWIEDTKRATQPHFEEVHELLFKARAKLQKQLSLGDENETGSSTKTALH